MVFAGQRCASFNKINMLPFTDVLLVLLVVLLIIVPAPRHVVLRVAEGGDECHPGHWHKVFIEVSRSGAVTVNGKPCRPDCIAVRRAIDREQFGAGKQEVRVEVLADADALHRHVVAVMDAAEGAGVRSLRMLPLRDY